MQRPLRKVALAVGALVAAFGFAYVLTYDRAGDQVLDGVHLGGTDLSGSTRAEALARITQVALPASDASFTLQAGASALTLPVADSGLAVEVGQTADRALAASWWDRLRSDRGHRREVAPVLSVDQHRLIAALQAMAKRFDRPAKEGAIAFRGFQPVAVLPESGREIDLAATATALRKAYPLSLAVELKVVTLRTRSAAGDVQQALQEVATPAVAGPISLAAGARQLVVQPLDLAKALTFEVQDSGELVPVVQAAALVAALGPRLAAARAGPVDATFDVSSGVPVVVPSQDGVKFTDADLVATVTPLLADPLPRTGALPVTNTPPRVSTALVKTLGVNKMISTFTTKHPCCAPRVTNIQRVADLVDGYVVLPGQTFSLNALIGKREAARGFVLAPQIEDGEFTYAVGGGISQFATTMFNAVFFSGLKDVEHQPHSFYIKRYPPGRESTVSFPRPDFQFQNDSPTGVLMKASYTPTSITVAFWGTPRFDIKAEQGPRTRVRDFGTQYITRPDCIKGEGEQGFDIEVARVFSVAGKVVRRQVFKTRYLPEPRFICGPDPRRAAPPPPG